MLKRQFAIFLVVTSSYLPFVSSQSCKKPPAATPDPNFKIEYEAYIPTDHVTGGPSAACLAKGHLTATYLGDVPYGKPSGFHTYRIWVFTDLWAGQPAQNQFSTYSINATYQFYSPTPVNNSYITAADYVPKSQLGLCVKENATATASFPRNGSLSTTYTTPSSTTAMLTETGTIANPLQSTLVSIGWNFTALETATTKSAYGLIFVAGTVTCYPQHIVLVSGLEVAHWIPSSNSPAYIAPCLVGPTVWPLSGIGTVGAGATVQVNQGIGVS